MGDTAKKFAPMLLGPIGIPFTARNLLKVGDGKSKKEIKYQYKTYTPGGDAGSSLMLDNPKKKQSYTNSLNAMGAQKFGLMQ